MPSNLMFPIIHHNMFLRKTKSAPILKSSSTFNNENDQLNQNVIYLQTMIDDMIQEYQYMDRPLKYPRNPEPSPITSNKLLSIPYPQRSYDSSTTNHGNEIPRGNRQEQSI